MHFSSGEVSMNLPPGADKPKSARKKSKKEATRTPVSIQKLFQSSTSEVGESTIADMTADANQVRKSSRNYL